ncbi:SpoIIE family protein phosphatase [Treponema sp. OMZ 840]|uniref:GAF domain-containing SpoIIE family protein phosphatase n=1 Tax=Treponema sp. OMZ 840 TaxID=244313 RepID=UPI003D8C636E
MIIDDSLAYIPLLLTLAVNAVLLVLFIILKVKRVHISIFQFLACAVIGAGSIFALQTGSLFLLSVTILSQSFLFILYSLVFFHKTSPEQERKSDLKSYLRRKKSASGKSGRGENNSADNELMEAGKNIVEISVDAISAQSELTLFADRLTGIVMQHTDADGSALLLVDDFEDLVSVKSLCGDFPPPYKLPDNFPIKEDMIRSHFKNADFSFEDNIFGHIVKTGNQELILSPQSDSRVFQNMQEDFLQASSYIFTPVKVSEAVVGVIALARKIGNIKFDTDDLEKVQILADFIGIAVKNMYAFQERSEHAELTREAYIAGKLQDTLYLKKIPPLPHLSVGSFFNTVEGVCSDYFDIIPSRTDRISFILADVTGKSMVSLTIMIMIRAILRVIINTPQTTATILGWANRGIALEKNIDHYASAALINYDARQKKIQFATAGTSPVLYFASAEKHWKKISSESEPLGVEKTTQYSDYTVQLNTGDLIVLYTDGLIEAVNDAGLQYSENRLKEVIGAHALRDGTQIADAVYADLTGFMGNAVSHDDQSLVVLKIQ